MRSHFAHDYFCTVVDICWEVFGDCLGGCWGGCWEVLEGFWQVFGKLLGGVWKVKGGFWQVLDGFWEVLGGAGGENGWDTGRTAL